MKALSWRWARKACDLKKFESASMSKCSSDYEAKPNYVHFRTDMKCQAMELQPAGGKSQLGEVASTFSLTRNDAL